MFMVYSGLGGGVGWCERPRSRVRLRRRALAAGRRSTQALPSRPQRLPGLGRGAGTADDRRNVPYLWGCAQPRWGGWWGVGCVVRAASGGSGGYEELAGEGMAGDGLTAWSAGWVLAWPEAGSLGTGWLKGWLCWGGGSAGQYARRPGVPPSPAGLADLQWGQFGICGRLQPSLL